MAAEKQDWKRLKLVVTKGGKKGEEYKLDRPTSGIGRSNLNQITLDDPGVSPFHAKVIIQGKTCIITDLGAHEGLKVNSKKIDTKVLTPGDRIQVGEASLEIVSDIPSQKPAPKPAQRKKETLPKKKVKLRIPIRISVLAVLLAVLLAAAVILDIHWLNQLLNWQ